MINGIKLFNKCISNETKKKYKAAIEATNINHPEMVFL